MGWTGGQYSLYRIALAVGAAAALAHAVSDLAARGGLSAAGGRGAALALVPVLVALAAGYYDALAALVLGFALAAIELHSPSASSRSSGASPLDAQSTALWVGLLLLHTRVPRDPFGAFEARHRTDPRGGWQRPAWLGDIAWALLVLVAAASAHHAQARSPESLTLVSALALEALAAAIGLASRRARPSVWIGLVLWRLALTFAAVAPIAESAPRLLLVLFAAEPAWWSGRSLRATRTVAERGAAAPPARLFYDGDCGFCHRSVRFVLAEELATPASLRLRFAPLGSATFRQCLARHAGLDPASLPDSIVLELEDGTILTRSAAALEVASRLGGLWRLLAIVGGRLPRGLLDAGYDAIARVRKRLFARPKDVCPILPPDLRARFDP